jgi:hypothetical protein
LATVVAIFAVAVPHTLKSWIRELWSASADAVDSDLPLSTARLSEVVRLVAQSPTASYWQKQFIEWMTEEPELAVLGARGLAGMCGLTHSCVVPLVTRIVQRQEDASLDAVGEFVRSHSNSPRFVEDATVLLRQVTDVPEVYDLLERAFLAAMTSTRQGALEAVERADQGPDLPLPVRETLARARQAIQSGVEEDLLRGEAPAPG